MIREMRRIKQLLCEEDIIKVMERNTAGVLAVIGDDDYPYAVPVSYVYVEGKVYIHSANQGHMVDGVKRSRKASFCVIDEDNVVPSEYTTYYRSVIAFGKPRIVEEENEKRFALKEIGKKYHPADLAENLGRLIDKEYGAVCVIALDVDHITGKEASKFQETKERAK